jgi:hypothetical protein
MSRNVESKNEVIADDALHAEDSSNDDTVNDARDLWPLETPTPRASGPTVEFPIQRRRLLPTAEEQPREAGPLSFG